MKEKLANVEVHDFTDIMQLRMMKPVNADSVLNFDKKAVHTDKKSVKSVKKVSAQNIELCELRDLTVLGQTIRRMLDPANTQIAAYEKAVIELQFLYGLRIAEVLAITYADVTVLGHIKVKGLKGSGDRIVYPVSFREFWQKVRMSKLTFSKGYNRWYFYRLYKKFGVYEILGNNKKMSVTHVLRYNYILSLLNSGMNTIEIQEVIGHKQLESTLHYVNKLTK